MRIVLVLTLFAGLLSGCNGDDKAAGRPAGASIAQMQATLKGAPAPLASLHRQSSQLLGGGKQAFEARLRGLRGRPAVVNKWASWCPPCRAEFSFFRNQAQKRGKEIAFIGVNAEDNDADAAKFLRELPVSFPSYTDPQSEIAASLDAAVSFPSTVFIDSEGEQAYVRQGGYSSERKLAEDIERYAR